MWPVASIWRSSLVHPLEYVVGSVHREGPQSLRTATKKWLVNKDNYVEKEDRRLTLYVLVYMLVRTAMVDEHGA